MQVFAQWEGPIYLVEDKQLKINPTPTICVQQHKVVACPGRVPTAHRHIQKADAKPIYYAALGLITSLRLQCFIKGCRQREQRPTSPLSSLQGFSMHKSETPRVERARPSHLNEGSVPDLAVQCFDVRGQVHVQQEVVLDQTAA